MNSNFSDGTNVYQAGGAIKLGKRTETGSITTKQLDLSQNGGRFMLSFDVKGWTTVEGDITVTITGQEPKTFTYTSTMSGEFQTIQRVFDGGTANATITFATTAKRAFLDNIKVYYFLGMQEIEISSIRFRMTAKRCRWRRLIRQELRCPRRRRCWFAENRAFIRTC